MKQTPTGSYSPWLLPSTATSSDHDTQPRRFMFLVRQSMLLAVNTQISAFASSPCLPRILPWSTFGTSQPFHLELVRCVSLVSQPAVIMIKAFLPLLLAQWHSTTKAQSSTQPQLCYYSANNLLESVFLPCGDPQNGFKSCCEAGDNCLANNACYSPRCKYSTYFGLSSFLAEKS
jgi:hypothetical protein